ncbi:MULTISPECIES: hypothetical protein [Calothrix]|uniref:Uncharacterized protein n=2 Tax=Calothrix TaxID=1186 RepID=A0ABR8A846_9CYAN|nr:MULTISPECIES: hypothetical protein [Calothrix]MBD2195221.1 hypothetical protein [Calothrix parietina FACHB-288]MBD2223808.1 hypothetical protein [Calothrix anomala FACHB-343]
MKQQQIIMGSISATVSAIAVGYLGVQYLNQNAMYTVAGAMMGLGATTQITQTKLKSPGKKSKRSPSPQPASPVVAVVEQAPQPIEPIYQPIEQQIEQKIEQKIEQPIEVAESDSSKELKLETDPVIERFLTLGLEDF